VFSVQKSPQALKSPPFVHLPEKNKMKAGMAMNGHGAKPGNGRTTIQLSGEDQQRIHWLSDQVLRLRSRPAPLGPEERFALDLFDRQRALILERALCLQQPSCDPTSHPICYSYSLSISRLSAFPPPPAAATFRSFAPPPPFRAVPPPQPQPQPPVVSGHIVQV